MTRLAGLQRKIQDTILGKNLDAKDLITSPLQDCQELSGQELSGQALTGNVYCTAYGLQLTEFLTCEYSMLRKYLGDLRFHEMAQGYIANNPSSEPNARWYARHLPTYLKTASQFIHQPEIAEIAQLENALNAAFDGPEAPVVTMAEVAAIDPADFSKARFQMAPTLHRFSVSTNVSSLWASLKCGVNPPVPENFREPAEIMVWRQGSGARFRILGKEEAIAVDCACQSLPFKVICEIIAAFDEGEDAALRAAGYLRGWLEAEIISSIRIDGEVEK